MRYAVAVLLLLAACAKSPTPTAPKTDPSVLLVNQTTDNVKLIWGTDAGIDTIIVPSRTTVCEKWLQSFDSLYVKIVDSVSTSYLDAYATLTVPWLHFGDYPYYFQVDTVLVTSGGQSVGIAQHIVDTECQ